MASSAAGTELLIEPVIPSDWPRFVVRYRYGQTVYEITVENPDSVCRGVVRIEVDGEPHPVAAIALTDDGKTHAIQVTLGRVEQVANLPDRELPGNGLRPLSTGPTFHRRGRGDRREKTQRSGIIEQTLIHFAPRSPLRPLRLCSDCVGIFG